MTSVSYHYNKPLFLSYSDMNYKILLNHYFSILLIFWMNLKKFVVVGVLQRNGINRMCVCVCGGGGDYKELAHANVEADKSQDPQGESVNWRQNSNGVVPAWAWKPGRADVSVLVQRREPMSQLVRSQAGGILYLGEDQVLCSIQVFNRVDRARLH